MRRGRRRRSSWLVTAGLVGFVVGSLTTFAVVSRPRQVVSTTVSVAETDGAAPIEVRPSEKETPPAVSAPTPDADAVDVVSIDPVEDLRRRRLTLPVQGVSRDDLRDTFAELRGGTRRHEALDVLAPRNTPVVAVEDGKVARLFLSEAGGMTVYQFDPTESYVYYYAHLDGYAPDLQEGDVVKRGQRLGYVGTTGNAPRDTPHLHFAIFRMTAEKRWWQGTAIDPYLVLE